MTLKHAEQRSRLSIVYDVRALCLLTDSLKQHSHYCGLPCTRVWAAGNVRGHETQFDVGSGKSNIIVDVDANLTSARIDKMKDISLAGLVPSRVDLK
jgi:hypothetical protein